MALSNRRHRDDSSIYSSDTKLSENLRSSMTSIFVKNEEKLQKLKDIQTLINLYKTGRDYKEQVKEEGVYSLITNKATEEILKQIEHITRILL